MHPFRYFVRVRYQDCDSQHVVFNARYGDYIDLAVTEFLAATMPERLPAPKRSATGLREPLVNDFEIQVRRQVTEFMAPARFQDAIEISAFTTRFGTSSFDIRFELRVAGTSDVIVRSDTTYVHVADAGGTWKSAPIPPDARAALEAGARGRIVDHAGYFPIVAG